MFDNLFFHRMAYIFNCLWLLGSVFKHWISVYVNYCFVWCNNIKLTLTCPYIRLIFILDGLYVILKKYVSAFEYRSEVHYACSITIDITDPSYDFAKVTCIPNDSDTPCVCENNKHFNFSSAEISIEFNINMYVVLNVQF